MSAKKITITDAAQTDLPTIIAIEREASVVAYAGEADLTEIDIRNWDWHARQERYQQFFLESPDGMLLIATVGNRLLGFAGAKLLDDNPEPTMHLGKLYVDVTQQRSGIGSALLAETEKRAVSQGATHLDLQVTQGNKNARKFYEAKGFSCTNEYPDETYLPTIGVSMTMLEYVKPLALDTSPSILES